jgi:hypothetical protein
MFETLKAREINDRGYFVGVEHPIHYCFEELGSDVSGEFPPNIVSAEFLDSFPIVLRVSIWVFLNFLP